MKKIFHLKIEETVRARVDTHMKEFNTIINQLSLVAIEFENEVRALILLASLLNNWGLMMATVSNSIGSTKLKFNNVRNRILAEQVRRSDYGEAVSSSALHVENRGKNHDINQNREKGRSKSRNYGSQSKPRRPFEC